MGQLFSLSKIALAAVGAFVAMTLTISHVAQKSIYCFGSAGCNQLVFDPRSRVGPVPLAVLGLLAYLALLILACLDASHRGKYSRLVSAAGLTLSTIGTGISCWLIYQLYFVMHGKCVWCVSSAIVMALLLFAWASAKPVEEANVPIWRALAVATLTFLLPLSVYGMAYRAKNLYLTHNPNALAKSTFEEMVPSDAFRKGPLEAEDLVVAFTDLECAACTSLIPKLLNAANDKGGAALVLRNYPLKGHDNAYKAAVAAEMLSEKRKMEEYILQCAKQEPSTIQQFLRIAAEIGVSTAEVDEQLRKGGPAKERVDRDLATVSQLAVQGTPMIFLVSRSGVRKRIEFSEAERMLR